jgi:hypothetical protein
MNCYRYTTTIFRFTIAAPTREEAAALALSSCGTGVLTEWLTPDVWTERVVEAATGAAVVDCVPRFVVVRGLTLDDIVDVDLDHVPAYLTPGEPAILRKDSAIHAAWLDALTAVHEGGAALHRYVVDVATCRDVERWPMFARALAGAYGLGPVPAWHAAILPALIALDHETATTGLDMGADPIDPRADLFELTRGRLADRLSWAALVAGPSMLRCLLRTMRDVLDHEPESTYREYAEATLSDLGWSSPSVPVASA